MGIYRASEIETLIGLPKARVNRYARERMYQVVLAGEAKRT